MVRPEAGLVRINGLLTLSWSSTMYQNLGLVRTHSPQTVPGPLGALSLREFMLWLLTLNRAHTSLRVTQEREMSQDNVHIKTEFVFGAEYASLPKLGFE